MAYINTIEITNDQSYLIEPTLYIAPNKDGTAYTANLANFSLVTGATVQAKFAATNDANATLNVNSTGAKKIYYNDAEITANQFTVNHVYTLVYDGTQWQVVGDIDTNTTYSTMSVAEARAGTATSGRLIRADRLKTFLSTLGGTGLNFVHTSEKIELNHSNSVTPKTAYVDVNTATTASANGGTIKVTDIKYDAQGHITGSQDRTITLSQVTSYLPVSYTNIDYTSTSTTAGVYPHNGIDNPVTNVTEYGGLIQFGGSSTSNDYYGAQLLVSSAAGETSPVHAYIRRMTKTPIWSSWSTLLDDKNYKSYAWAHPASITTNQVLVSSGTAGETTLRGIRNNTTVDALGWTKNATDNTLITTNTLAYWDGRYTTTDNKSNLKYYSGGAFGTMAKETATDYAKLSNAAFTGAVTVQAPTADANPATKKYVDDQISASFAANNAMVYKGIIAGAATSDDNAYGALTPAANCGDTYKVSVAGFINGLRVEIGDMLICTTDNTLAAATSGDNIYTTIRNNWNIIQTSEGSVSTSSTSATDNAIARWDGTSGRIIQNSTTTLDDSGNISSSVSTTGSLRYKVTNSNGAVSMLTSTNRGLYDETKSNWIIYRTQDGNHTYVPYWKEKGTSTTPAYFDASGEPVAGDQYAGGTAVTLNSASKAKSTASFYAPTDSGTAGYILISGGANTAPAWTSNARISSETLLLYRESTTSDNSPSGIVFQNRDTTVSRTQGTAYIYAYNTHANNGNGMNMVIHSAGNIFVGGGESPANLYNTLKSSTSENLYLTADSSIYLEGSCGNTIGNRIGIAISSGHVLPVKAESTTSNVQNLGATNALWANVYATTFHGNLEGDVTGNADTATSAGKWTTARTLTIGNTGKSVDGSGNVSWTLADIGAAPSSTISCTTANVESALGIDFITYTSALNTNGWKTLGGRDKGAKIAIAYNNNPASWNSATYSASLVFGCADTRGLLDLGHGTPVVTFGGASNANSTDDNPKWYFKLSGTSGQTYTFPSTSKTLAATDGSNASGKWSISTSGKADTAGTADKATAANITPTTNSFAFYTDTAGKFGHTSGYVKYLNHTAITAGTSSTAKYIDGISITGTAFNAAADVTSGIDGVLSYGDAGPQIRFTDVDQSGVLLFHRWNNGSSTVSFNFLSNQGGEGALVRAGCLMANTRAYIGYNTLDTNYTLKVNGAAYINGATTINGNLIFPTANILDWNSDTYRQRIAITDDSTANTAVFTFQQSTDSGSNYTDLFTIKDNGTVVATTFDGNATTATKSGIATIWLYPENTNEINFGGTNTNKTLYIGYRAKDSRPIPTKFIFGGSTGTADLQVKTVYLGSGTSSYISSTQYTGNAATATSATRLSYNTTVSTKSGLQYVVGQPTIGSNDGNAKEGSNNSPTLWSYPTGGTAATTVANIQNLRLYWGTDGKYFRDIFLSPNNSAIYHRAVNNGTAGDWFKILDSNNTSAASATGADISVSWNASTKIATINGVDVKIKIPSNPNTNTTYTFAEGSTNGAFSVTPSGGSAQSVSIHGLGSAAYTASTAYATATQGTKADNALPRSGGVLTGDLGLKTTSADSPDIVWWYGNTDKEQARIWMGSGGTTKWAPLYRCYKSDGTNLYEGHLVLGDGTGASGSWGINITGSSASCTGNAATATSAGSATHADYLTGFSSRVTTMTWGNQTGSVITCFATPKGGGWGFRDDNPAAGQVSMTIDGTIYIKEGGVNIADAVKSFSVSGQTVTYTNLWNGTGTFTTQDTKNTAGSTNSDSKLYLIGAASQAANPQTYSNSHVFETNGAFSAKTLGVNADTDNDKVTLQWNSTDNSLDFVFA